MFLMELVLVQEKDYCNRKTFCGRNKNLSQRNKKKYVIETNFCQTIISVTEKISLTKTSFHHKNKFLSEILSKNHIFVTKKEGQTVAKKRFVSQKKILPKTKVLSVSVRKKSFHH